MATVRFLYSNRFDLVFEEDEAYRFIMGIESKRFNLEEIGNWLRKHSRKMTRREHS